MGKEYPIDSKWIEIVPESHFYYPDWDKKAEAMTSVVLRVTSGHFCLHPVLYFTFTVTVNVLVGSTPVSQGR